MNKKEIVAFVASLSLLAVTINYVMTNDIMAFTAWQWVGTIIIFLVIFAYWWHLFSELD